MNTSIKPRQKYASEKENIIEKKKCIFMSFFYTLAYILYTLLFILFLFIVTLLQAIVYRLQCTDQCLLQQQHTQKYIEKSYSNVCRTTITKFKSFMFLLFPEKGWSSEAVEIPVDLWMRVWKLGQVL